MDREVGLREILDSRERRAASQGTLRERHAMPVLSYTLNIAGPIKRTELLRRGFDLGLRRLAEQLARHGLRPAEELRTEAPTGDEWLCAIPGEPLTLKRLTCAVEDADALGRLMDVDVLDPQGRKIERGEVGLPPRRCLLCEREARLCGRSRAHPEEALFARAELMAREALQADVADRLSSLAQRALLYELSVTPKPGLVDRHNNGAHRDMDFFTFLDSASILPAYFWDCVLLCLNRPEDQMLEALRYRGQCAETRMLEATKGVTTHKGAIFSLGLLCGAAGLCCRSVDWPSVEELCETAARLSQPLLSDFATGSADTAGLRLHRASGVQGARGEAARGFPTVRQAALPALRKALSRGRTFEQAGVMALLALLESAEDTNLFHRGGAAKRAEVAQRAGELLACETPPIREVQVLDEAMIKQNLSPGGCADLLAVTFFLYFVAESMG